MGKQSKQNEGYEQESRPKKKRTKRILLGVLFAFLFIVGIICFYITYLLNSVDRTELTKSEEELGITDDVWQDKNVINIALFGVDSRSVEENIGRSDAIMIASFDGKHHKVKIVSIMRDSQVKVDGYGYTKINHAYAYGGAELAIKTLNQNFGLNIKDYVTVNFYQLADVIDALGGMELEITEAERKNMNVYIKEAADFAGRDYETVKKSGLQKLTGEQVVAYARIRYVGNSDFTRTERQREVIEKVFQQMLNTNVLRYPALLDTLLPMIETSLSNTEILGVASKLIMFGTPKFEQGRFPLDGQYRSGGGNLIYDLDAAANKLHRFLYGNEPFYEEAEENE